jgi:hypothetical protein
MLTVAAVLLDVIELFNRRFFRIVFLKISTCGAKDRSKVENDSSDNDEEDENHCEL